MKYKQCDKDADVKSHSLWYIDCLRAGRKDAVCAAWFLSIQWLFACGCCRDANRNSRFVLSDFIRIHDLMFYTEIQ